jgi:Uma2 family endonuclease
LVERHVGSYAGLIEGLVFGRLFIHCDTSKSAHIWTGTTGCRCFPDEPDKIRKPDVMLMLRDRYSEEHLSDGFLTIRPDLVVEVISPNDLAYVLAEKIEEYLALGIPLIWIVNPETRTVEINRPDGSVTRLHASDEITGEGVLPGFRCRVDAFFPPAKGSGPK